MLNQSDKLRVLIRVMNRVQALQQMHRPVLLDLVPCVTYCVGGFKVVNPIAQAFAEKSPLVVISGAPGITERKKNAPLHHKVRNFDTQLEIFKQSILIDCFVYSEGQQTESILSDREKISSVIPELGLDVDDLTGTWLEEAISKGIKKLSDDELSQFLELTNGTTFGFFKITCYIALA